MKIGEKVCGDSNLNIIWRKSDQGISCQLNGEDVNMNGWEEYQIEEFSLSNS